MSAFSSLPVFLQTLIPLLLFVEAVLELGLFIYQLSHRSKLHDNLPSLVIFAFLLTLLFSVTQGDPFNGKDAFLLESIAAERTCYLHFPLKMPQTSCLWVCALPIRTGVLSFAMTVCVICRLH